jgi:epidermal growth factor receptor substrate 15
VRKGRCHNQVFILQRLTGMGFTRDESLDALEKYDYNLDKVGSLSTIKE